MEEKTLQNLILLLVGFISLVGILLIIFVGFPTELIM